MTFVEAAIEILKREGKPLSSRRLAELAVKLNLLSVVGRDPEATMQERLDDAMSRAVRHPELVQLKPDTFGLHAYPERVEPVNGAQAHGAAATGATGDAATGEAGEAGGEKKGRRRRRRGRRDGEATPASHEGGEGQAADSGDEAVETIDAAEAATADEGAPTATGEAAPAAAAEGEAGADGKKGRRRRRGGRGRRRREGGPVAGANGDEPATAAADDEAEADADADDADARQGEPPSPRPMPAALPSEAEAAGTPSGGAVLASGRDAAPTGARDATDAGADAEAEAELLDAGAAPVDVDGEDDLDEDLDHDTGPLLAPASGAEDVTRTDDDRTVRPEIRGSRDERHRRDRHHKDRGRDRHKDRDHKRPEARPGEARGHEPRPHEARGHEARGHEARPHEPHPNDPRAHEARPHHEARPSHEPRLPDTRPAPATATAERGLIDSILDVLRSSDGRPMHVRQIAETAAKRRLTDDRTAPPEMMRLMRAALVREQRDRDAEGLRARVRALGGGQYGAVDRKLDTELVQAERELADRAARLRDATRAAIRRRLGRMVPGAFETLGRALCEKLGIGGLELVRRGDGVTYWGGARQSGVATVRTLVAFRAGEGEINRRAVGELRAGLAAKGYDEGLLFGAGRPNAEALAELKHGGVSLHDGGAMSNLLYKHGLGVRRVAMPIDYLDLDFFAELTEG